MKQALILAIFSVIFMTACSSKTSQNTQYYLLNSPTQARTDIATNENLPLVALKLIELPDYLKEPSLVLQLSDHQLHYSHFHMWAEPLQMSLAESLIQELNISESHYYYLAESTPSDTAVKTNIMVKITAFHTTHQSQALLAGSYWFLHNDLNKDEKK